MPRVLYVAAHGGFGGQAVPLGGGAAIFNQLTGEWKRTGAVDVTPVTPAILGIGAPSGADLVGYSETAYARFCLRFGAAATAEVLRHDPAQSVVLVNDISEAPDFARIAAAGFLIHTIYHVDVVAYVATMYGRGLIPASWLTRFWDKVSGLPWPELLRLVFDRQRDSLRYSRTVVVPSSGMKRLLLECYPWVPEQRIQVLPWGVYPGPPPPTAAQRSERRRELGIPADAHVLLALSRISPEKGQDLLLESLARWEDQPGFPQRPVFLLLCGEAAYMQGRRFFSKLQRAAARLRKVRVVFPGYVTGDRKRACHEASDLYVFPSRHESYGLTLMEALAAGLPSVAFAHDGARDILQPEFGVLLERRDPALLAETIAALLADTPKRQAMAQAARVYAEAQSFPATAQRLADILSGRHLAK